MPPDPWSRPTLSDLHMVLESVGRDVVHDQRVVARLELAVPAEITTARGNVVSAMTREISRGGIGLIHRGSLSPGAVRVKMASETREFDYRVEIEWCVPANDGMFLSGGRFATESAGV